MSKHPEWATRHKRKGTELRLINGTYYLYEASSKWDPEKKRPKKITGKLLGKITQEQGFVISDKERLRKSHREVEKLVVKEFGVTLLISSVLEQYPKLLQKHFPGFWQQIMVLAYGRICYLSPLKNMSLHFQHSYLSELYQNINLSPKEISGLLRQIGSNRTAIISFFNEFNRAGDSILFDGTDITSCSNQIGINKKGRSKQGTYDRLINLMFVFSLEQKLPVYYRIAPGNIKDVKSFKICLQESGVKDAVIIADKGFYSNSNVAQLIDQGLMFIVPLKRDSTLIDYTIAMNADKKQFDGFFKFHDRVIWHYTLEHGNNRVIVYLDQELKTREEKDYLDRIDSCPEKFTIEKFYQKQAAFGTIAMLTNTGKSPEKTFASYKSRDAVEQMIDTFKNTIEADRSYMQNEQALEGWMFINYIALHWHYRIYQMLSQNELLSKYSTSDIVKILTEVRKVKVNQTWHNAESTKKTMDLIAKLGVHIT